jgi:hypothetical protein
LNFRALFSETRRFVVLGVLSNPLAPVAAAAVIFAVGALLQFSRPLNHDVGWLLVAAGQWLDGGRIYEEVVVEWNPPLILYLFAPAVAWARETGASEIATFRVLTFGVAAASIGLNDRLLERLLGPGRVTARRTLDAVLAFAFTVHVGADFGQREHFVAMLALPYALALAARARGIALPPGLASAIGVGAGIGSLIKPQYAVLVAAAELTLALHARSLRGLWRAESIAFATFAIGYAASVVIWLPGYVDVVLPLALDGYWAYQRPLAELVTTRGLALLGLATLCPLAFRRDPELRSLGWALLVTTVGCYGAMLVQATGWRYSRLPFETCAMLLGAISLVALAKAPAARAPLKLGRRVLGAGVAGALVGFGLLAAPSIATPLERGAVWRRGDTAGITRAVQSVLEAEGADSGVYFLSVGVAGAFPAVNYSRARWASRFSCLWPLAAVVRAQDGDPRTPSRLTPERLARMERYLRDAVASDLERHAPAVVFVDTRRRHAFFGNSEVDLLAFFRSDPRFEATWSHYEPTQRLGFYDVYRRGDGDRTLQQP